jgi:hypothetical protein
MTQIYSAFSSWPFEWARNLFQIQASAQRRALARFDPCFPATATRLPEAALAWPVSSVAAGFDLIRSNYAAAVQAGLTERSLLASGALELRLAMLERVALGPWARSV